MFCWNCGKRISDTVLFCGHCGAEQHSSKKSGHELFRVEHVPVQQRQNTESQAGSSKPSRWPIIFLVIGLIILVIGGYLLTEFIKGRISKRDSGTGSEAIHSEREEIEIEQRVFDSPIAVEKPKSIHYNSYSYSYETFDGYKIKATLSISDWIKASERDLIISEWEQIGGKDNPPEMSEFENAKWGQVWNFYDDTSAVLFGTISFTNITQGYDATPDHPIEGRMLFDFMFDTSIKQIGAPIWPIMLIEFANGREFRHVYRNGTPIEQRLPADISANMTGNNWGPVPFMIAANDVFGPNHPDGNESLDSIVVRILPKHYSISTSAITNDPSLIRESEVSFELDKTWDDQSQKVEAITKDETNDDYDYQVINLESIRSSSELNGGDYDADNVLDGRNDTAWVEGIDGDGIGEYIEFIIPADTQITGVRIMSGYHKTDDLFIKNGAPTEITIVSGSSTTVIKPNPSYGESEFFDLHTTDGQGFPCRDGIVRFVIDAVRSGTVYNDTCISSIELYTD